MTEQLPNLPATTQAALSGLLLPEGAELSPDVEQKIDAWQRTLYKMEACRLYEPEDDTPEEQSYAGMTNLQVFVKKMWKRSTGKKPQEWMAKFLQEHTFGKAVQRVETKAVHLTYQDLLHQVEQAEGRFQEVVSVEVTDETERDSQPSWADLI